MAGFVDPAMRDVRLSVTRVVPQLLSHDAVVMAADDQRRRLCGPAGGDVGGVERGSKPLDGTQVVRQMQQYPGADVGVCSIKVPRRGGDRDGPRFLSLGSSIYRPDAISTTGSGFAFVIAWYCGIQPA